MMDPNWNMGVVAFFANVPRGVNDQIKEMLSADECKEALSYLKSMGVKVQYYSIKKSGILIEGD